jgi:acid phosphatase (class A)
MKKSMVAGALVAVAGSVCWWTRQDQPHFLAMDRAVFVATFDAPPTSDSAGTRQELAQLLELQRTRSGADIAAARADRKTDVERFFGALGLQEPQANLPLVARLADRVEDDVRIYVRAAKRRFLRLRPYKIEPRLEPCLSNVRGDLSYPSGHATYGYAIAYLLSEMVPERRGRLLARADEFARQRMVCGVHFPSDLEAGRKGAAWLVQRLLADPEYAAEAREAARELRARLRLPDPPRPP